MHNSASSQHRPTVAVACADLRDAVAALRTAVEGDAFGWAADSEIADALIDLISIERQITALKARLQLECPVAMPSQKQVFAMARLGCVHVQMSHSRVHGEPSSTASGCWQCH